MTVLVRDASIRTAAVEIRALTVSGRKMTLAIYDQLPDLAPNLIHVGTPWGWVNRHDPRRCGGRSEWDLHRHVIAEYTDELWTCEVPRPVSLEQADADCAAEMAAAEWMTLGINHRYDRPTGKRVHTDDDIRNAMTARRHWREVIFRCRNSSSEADPCA